MNIVLLWNECSDALCSATSTCTTKTKIHWTTIPRETWCCCRTGSTLGCITLVRFYHWSAKLVVRRSYAVPARMALLSSAPTNAQIAFKPQARVHAAENYRECRESAPFVVSPLCGLPRTEDNPFSVLALAQTGDINAGAKEKGKCPAALSGGGARSDQETSIALSSTGG